MKTIFTFKRNVMLILFLSVLSLTAHEEAQAGCRDSYNYALGFYNRGNYDNINNYLKDCLAEMSTNRQNYQSGGAQLMLFKVYKICINSSRNLEHGSLAEQQLKTLMDLSRLSRAAVLAKLNETPLTPIE